jgi:undecaprenyl-diphosphatase
MPIAFAVSIPVALQAFLIGVVQGLTEFLPVSSSAHLIVLPPLLGWNDPFLNSATFDVMLHGGTLIALLVYFWREFVGLAAAFIASLAERRIGGDPERRLAWLVLVTLVPAAVLGFALEDFLDTAFRERLVFVAVFLVGGAAFLWAAEWYAKRRGGERDLDRATLGDAIAIGGAQAIALFPGFSRSGVTIATGLFRGLRRDEAAHFSFLMGTPIIAGATIWKARVLVSDGGAAVEWVPLLAGLAGATLAGLLAIRFLLGYLRRHTTGIFIAWRLIFAAVVVAWLLAR